MNVRDDQDVTPTSSASRTHPQGARPYEVYDIARRFLRGAELLAAFELQCAVWDALPPNSSFLAPVIIPVGVVTPDERLLIEALAYRVRYDALANLLAAVQPRRRRGAA